MPRRMGEHCIDLAGLRCEIGAGQHAVTIFNGPAPLELADGDELWATEIATGSPAVVDVWFSTDFQKRTR